MTLGVRVTRLALAIALAALTLILAGGHASSEGSGGEGGGGASAAWLAVNAKIEGSKVLVVYRNQGEAKVYMPFSYSVEVYREGGWEPCTSLTPDVFAQGLIELDPGEEYVLEIDVSAADPGLYRVVKEAWAGSPSQANEKITLYTEFRVP